MTIDDGSLYVLTSQSVWKVPVAGGTPTPIAGGLGGQIAQSACSTGTGAASMVMDSSNVYIALDVGVFVIPK